MWRKTSQTFPESKNVKYKLQVYIITYVVDGKGLHETTCLVEIELKQGERIREKQDSGFLDTNAWNS